ncbi:LacI family transcriptional regulator [Paenibacillus alginolyticus]|uniref:LacI family DNA-binding transcriptional regulator n=1 Tax=Paenibacillus alginolyticus TaxID=59839 RepID=UPI000419CD61|nr:LacI family DNA-binding transcriptional regulator [Paenibacillus alginolyticus]MCY9669217.1 LacI family transcriptional regulator [Paenibacillus alginolyticus]
MVTMKDISKVARVSIATVSAVINKSAYVSPELAERVNTAIEELNYRPNAIARSLKMNSTLTVGVIITDISNPYYAAMIKGMDDAAMKKNFSLILCITSNDHDRFNNYLKVLMEKRVDGLLLTSISHQDDLQRVERTGIKYVLVNRKPPAYDRNFVGVNNPLTSELSVKHLVSQGKKRIAYFAGDLQISTARERWEGFISGMRQNGLQIDDSLMFQGSYSQESGYTNVKKMLSEVKVLPDAICAASDLVAFGAIKALRESGIRVPDDIAVIGNDNNSFSENFIVPLSTIDHPTYEMGKISMEFMLQMIEGKDEGQNRQIILTPSLVVRESSGSSI